MGVTAQEIEPDLLASAANVHCYGYLDRSVAGERKLYNGLMRAARLFVFPMRLGPVAGVVREVQLNCIPVVISRAPGASERVTDDYNGVLVDTLEPKTSLGTRTRS